MAAAAASPNSAPRVVKRPSAEDEDDSDKVDSPAASHSPLAPGSRAAADAATASSVDAKGRPNAVLRLPGAHLDRRSLNRTSSLERLQIVEVCFEFSVVFVACH